MTSCKNVNGKIVYAVWSHIANIASQKKSLVADETKGIGKQVKIASHDDFFLLLTCMSMIH